MANEYFGTDGIRGVAGVYPLDAEMVLQAGKAVGMRFAQPGERILLGYDTRESRLQLAASMAAGIMAVGVNVELVREIPTPGLAYLTRESTANASVMLTASHNPYKDNGIKIFNSNGGKLSDNAEDEIAALMNSRIPSRGFGQQYDVSERTTKYEKFIKNNGTDMSGLKIAIDMANGATSGYATRIFRDLRAQVVPLFDTPDGRNINAGCGATDTKVLQEVVARLGLDMGLAFDGDGDRLMMVDNQGRLLTGDNILHINAIQGGEKGVVSTIMSNMALELALSESGIAFDRRDVGDRYVLEGLAETGHNLGGEQSGHIVFSNILNTGDGMLAAVKTIQNVRKSGLTLAQWKDKLPLMPQRLINIPVKDKDAVLSNPDVAKLLVEAQADLQGVGRVSGRASGTQELFRIMVESKDADDRCAQLAQRVVELIA